MQASRVGQALRAGARPFHEQVCVMKLTSKALPSSEAFRLNRDSHLVALAEIREAAEAARQGGGEKARARHVSRGSGLTRIGQTVCVAEVSGLHAQRARFLGHHGGKLRFRTAEIFGNGGRNIIGRLGGQSQNGVVDGDRGTGLEAELRRRLRGSVFRDRDARLLRDVTVLQSLEHHVKGHHLGQRGREAGRIRVTREQRFTGLGVNDDRRVFRVCRRAGGG